MKIYDRVEATPARVLGVIEQVLYLQKTPIVKERVVSLMQPKTLKGEAKAKGLAAAANAIEILIAVGVLEESVKDDTTSVSLPGSLRKQLHTTSTSEEWNVVLAKALLQPEIQGVPNALADVVAFLLTFKPLEVPQGKANLKESLKANGFSLDEYGLNGDTPLNTLLYWITYLGLLWQQQDKIGEGLVADPTAYLRRHLSMILKPGETVTTSEFCRRLGELCPVLDGGIVRSRVLERMIEAGTLASWPKHHLSPAISFSLRRLIDENLLETIATPDAREIWVMSHGEIVELIKRPIAESGR